MKKCRFFEKKSLTKIFWDFLLLVFLIILPYLRVGVYNTQFEEANIRDLTVLDMVEVRVSKNILSLLASETSLPYDFLKVLHIIFVLIIFIILLKKYIYM